MKKRFISIRSKIFGVQMLAAVFVIVVMSALGIFYYTRLIQEKVRRLMEQNNEQAVESVEMILDNAIRLTEYPMVDGSVSDLLNRNFEEIPYERRKYEKIRATKQIDNAIYAGIFYENPYVHSVEWSAQNMKGMHAIGVSPVGTINTYEEFAAQEWCQELLAAGGLGVVLDLHRDAFLTQRGEYISVGRSLVTKAMENKSAGVVKINIKISALQHILALSGFADSSVSVLTDRNGRIICQMPGMENGSEEKEELIRLLDKEQETNLVWQGRKCERVVQESEKYGWKLVKIIPYEVMYEELIEFRRVSGSVLLLMLLILPGITYLLSRSITKPILELSGCLKEMKRGNWKVRAKGGNDETGVLAEAFNEMAERIQESVDEIYKTQEEKRKAELMALQAQINPHFLYNTLRSIRWMADVQGADNVTKAIDDLIQLFRLTTQIQGEYITIAEDLNIIKVYSEILMIRYMDWFRVEYEIDEELLSCRTIKFLLQPLLENAIYHGFQDSRQENLIRIIVRKDAQNIIFEVYDNGCGMDEETIEKVLMFTKEDGKGYNKIGVCNVNSRIQQSFGKEYGLEFESRPGSYTIARAIIPAIK